MESGVRLPDGTPASQGQSPMTVRDGSGPGVTPKKEKEKEYGFD